VAPRPGRPWPPNSPKPSLSLSHPTTDAISHIYTTSLIPEPTIALSHSSTIALMYACPVALMSRCHSGSPTCPQGPPCSLPGPADFSLMPRTTHLHTVGLQAFTPKGRQLKEAQMRPPLPASTHARLPYHPAALPNSRPYALPPYSPTACSTLPLSVLSHNDGHSSRLRPPPSPQCSPPRLPSASLKTHHRASDPSTSPPARHSAMRLHITSASNITNGSPANAAVRSRATPHQLDSLC
jgi:hypothetical protein